MEAFHIPVLGQAVLEYLAVRPDGIYLDATAGLGGHTLLIARRLTTGFVIANDRDPETLELARQKTAEFAGRIRFHHGRFSELRSALRVHAVKQVDGLVCDLGVSTYQLTSPERGMSLFMEGPLDFRMDRTSGLPASHLINNLAEKALADLLYLQGEERRARKIARAIVRARPIRSTLHLAGVVERAVPRTGRLHPATLTFMALRLAINEEPEELERLLEDAPGMLKPGGRMVVISFMSLEDRKVKERFRELARQGRAELLTRRPLTPSEEETQRNPPSRSAKLRAIEMRG